MANKTNQPSTFNKVVAGCFVAVSLCFLVVAFFSGHVTSIQYTILVWVVGPVTAIVSAVFTGQLAVTESKWGNLAVTATGGFAVWFLFFLFTPVPNESVVNILLKRNGQLVKEPRSVKIVFANDARTETAVNGQVTFRLPSHIDQL